MAAVDALLKAKANVNLQDNDGKTALHKAAHNGYTEIVKALLAVDGIKINVKYELIGKTALDMAAQNGHLAVVKLIETKANVNLQDKNDDTALSLSNKKITTSETIPTLKQFQILNDTDTFEMLNEPENFALVKSLIEAGANVNWQNKDGETALHMAAQKGHLEIVNLLKKTKTNINLPDKDSNSIEETHDKLIDENLEEKFEMINHDKPVYENLEEQFEMINHDKPVYENLEEQFEMINHDNLSSLEIEEKNVTQPPVKLNPSKSNVY